MHIFVIVDPHIYFLSLLFSSFLLFCFGFSFYVYRINKQTTFVPTTFLPTTFAPTTFIPTTTFQPTVTPNPTSPPSGSE